MSNEPFEHRKTFEKPKAICTCPTLSASELMKYFHPCKPTKNLIRSVQINPYSGETIIEDRNGNKIKGVIEHINWDYFIK